MAAGADVERWSRSLDLIGESWWRLELMARGGGGGLSWWRDVVEV